MKVILNDFKSRRRNLRFAVVGGLAALLLALLLAPDALSQQPPAPHWFWGSDAQAYAGSEIKAFNQDGDEVETGGEGSGRIGADGRWFTAISREGGTEQVKLRIVSSKGDRETALMDVIQGGFDSQGLSITAFKTVEDSLSATDDDTLTIRIRARVYPSDEDPSIPFRSIEFNLSVGDRAQELNDNPRQRTIRPNHANERWYRSNPFDLGNGFEAYVIACKAPDGGTRFGVRVDGRDDIIPRLNLLPASRTSTNWARSNEFEIQLPTDNRNVERPGRPDEDCRFGK